MVAQDQGARLAAGHGAVAVATYRDMLAAVYAARDLTNAGDAASYQKAAALLEPVRARLSEIFPTVLERSQDYGYARNAIDLRFGGAQSAIRAWLARLELGSTIRPDPLVIEFQVGATEIKLGTGERVDDRDLRALDGAAVTSAKAVGIATAVVVLLPVAAELGAMAGAKLTGSTIGAWAATHPMQALALAEFVISTGIGIGEAGGPRAYVDGLKENIPLTILQILMDIANYRQAGEVDKELQKGPSGGGMRELPAGEAPPAAPRGKVLPSGTGEEGGAVSGGLASANQATPEESLSDTTPKTPAPTWEDIVEMETAPNQGTRMQLAERIVAHPDAVYHHNVYKGGTRAIVATSEFKAGDGTASFGGERSVRAYIGSVNPAAAKVTKVPIIEFMPAGGEVPQTRLFSGRPGAYWVSDGALRVKIVRVFLPDGRVAVPDGAGALRVTNPDGTVDRLSIEDLPE